MTSVVQINTDQLRLTIDQMVEFKDIFELKRQHTYQIMDAMICDIFDGYVQTICTNVLVSFHPQYVETTSLLDSFIEKLRALLARFEAADSYTHANCAPAMPPPRIYLFNGMGSTAEPGEIEQSVKDIKQLIMNNSTIPDVEIVLVPAIFNNNLEINSARDFLLLTGIDNPLEQTIHSYLTHVDERVNSTIRLVQGAGDVLHETTNPYAQYTQQSMEWIKQYELLHPLVPDQKIITIGYSGGGAVAANTSHLLETDLGHDVVGVVTFGSPFIHENLAEQHATTVRIINNDDVLVSNPLANYAVRPFKAGLTSGELFDEFAINIDLGDSNAPYSSITEEIGNVAGAGAHSSYLYNPQVLEAISKHIPEFAQFTQAECLEEK